MSTYYPNEFLPENQDLDVPKTRNYFRNKLPLDETSKNQDDIDVVANFGKKQEFTTSSINNTDVLNTYETNKNIDNNKSKSNSTSKSRITRVNIDSRLRNTQPKHILDSKLNNLQNKANKKIILPDEKLQFLLGINEEQELTYFNLQKYMNKHFISEPVSTI